MPRKRISFRDAVLDGFKELDRQIAERYNDMGKFFKTFTNLGISCTEGKEHLWEVYAYGAKCVHCDLLFSLKELTTRTLLEHAILRARANFMKKKTKGIGISVKNLKSKGETKNG